MAISTLTTTIKTEITWNAQKTVTGTDYNPITNSGSLRKSLDNGTAIANASLGGADEIVSYLITIAASGNTTVDVNALTDILNLSANYQRIKAYIIRLLAVADDATYGTACSSITVGNAASVSQQLGISSSGTIDIFSGGCLCYFDRRAAGFVTSTNKNIKIVNNDGAVSAVVQLTLVGGTS